MLEALACGPLVISDNQKDVFELFVEGEHLSCFDAADDLIEKIEYYLDRSGERKKIARQGRQEVIKNHTYVHRLKKLLEIVNR